MKKHFESRSFWRTRFGFYMAAIGSALGLANLWRFPYVVSENGGGAFVLLYVLVAMIIGLPMLIAELMLGKISRRSVVQAFANFGPQYTWIGRFVVGLTILVLAYYAVISGWVLYLLASFVTKALVPALPFTTSLKVLMDNGWLQLGVVSIHLLIGVLIIGKDLQEGLERWVSVMMPLFALFLIMMLILSLSLPSALTSFRFLFYPDFSELRPSSLIQAIGHVFFTLSIGFGVMITFGRYMSESDHIPSEGVRVAIVDTIISLIGILIVIPIAIGATNLQLSDPTLLFEALPRFLNERSAGIYIGVVFFACLYIAALSATIGLFESVVTNLMDRRQFSRAKAAWVCGVIALLLATLPALSSSTLQFVKIKGHTILELLDMILINWLLPIVGAILAILVSRNLKGRREHFINPKKMVSAELYSHWEFILKWVVPGLVLFAILIQCFAWVG